MPSIKIALEPIPLLVPIKERKAGEVCPSSNATLTSSSMVMPKPPYSSGIVSPNKPSSRICCTMSSGILSFSTTSFSRGINSFFTKSRIVESNCSNIPSSRIICDLPSYVFSSYPSANSSLSGYHVLNLVYCGFVS
ncbi:hypothetical protein D3C81_214070 [compost metagenome]